MVIRRPTVFAACALTFLIAATLSAQTQSVDDLVAIGLRQLEAARAAGSEQGYQAADMIFAGILARDPNNPQALFARGQIEFARALPLAAQGKMGPSIELFQAGMADMDRAISVAPERLDLRLARGLAYANFPALYKLAGTVRDDLEIAVQHAGFRSLPSDQRARAWLALGKAYANLNEKDKALQSLRGAIEAEPGSPFAREASERLKAVASDAPYQPDRFPNIAANIAPLLVVVSFTRPSAATDGTQAMMKETMKALEPIPGLLSQHLAISVDTPGMFLLFTWWKDKQAVNAFYYSDFHQRLAGGRGQAITGGATFQADQVPSQMGIEVLAPLPGGIQMGGGFIPQGLFQRVPRQDDRSTVPPAGRQ